jgi:hypothetical protein
MLMHGPFLLSSPSICSFTSLQPRTRARCGDSKVKAAAVLGLTREGLRQKMLRYGI